MNLKYIVIVHSNVNSYVLLVTNGNFCLFILKIVQRDDGALKGLSKNNINYNLCSTV